MKNKADYSKYECPYSHLEKECGHELKGPEGYEDVYGVWCQCGFRGPVFYLEPTELNLKLKAAPEIQQPTNGSMASGASAPSAQICPNCKGSGDQPQLLPEPCDRCGGSGKLHTA